MMAKNEGFLLFEILFTLVILTAFVTLCTRYQAESIRAQTNIVKVMKNLDNADSVLDTYVYGKTPRNISNGKHFGGDSFPLVKRTSTFNSPLNFSFDFEKNLKIIVLRLPGGHGLVTLYAEDNSGL